MEDKAEETEEEILNRIFIGDFYNLPSIASKIVRIFTSSTFTGNFVTSKPFVVAIKYLIKILLLKEIYLWKPCIQN